MKNNKFIQGTIILIFGGMLTKIIGFFIKILYTRILGPEGISYFTIIFPTYSLFVAFASCGLPIAIAKLVAERKLSIQQLFKSLWFFIIIINIILTGIIILSANFIATNLLHAPETKIIIYACIFSLPFITITSVLKGYFYGRQNMMPNIISNIVEQIIKICLILLILPKILLVNITLAVFYLFMFNGITELASIIVFSLFLPPKNKETINNDHYLSDILKIAIPTISSRLIGNIGYFLEPIMITKVLLYVGFTKQYILKEYSIINAYIFPLLLLPSFFISAIATSLVPELSNFFWQNDFQRIKKRIKQALGISFFIGLIYSFILLLFGSNLLNIIYHIKEGYSYLLILIPGFLMFYIEAPLISALQALNKVKIAFKITTMGVILKLSTILILGLFKTGLYCLIGAELINIFFVVILDAYWVNKTLKYYLVIK